MNRLLADQPQAARVAAVPGHGLDPHRWWTQLLVNPLLGATPTQESVWRD
ncbi:MAG: hypothetical protein SGJ09_01475 [Phycisphaerae bacterium]|nr:hypothetical protein [Phycisphaerae bacterium]